LSSSLDIAPTIIDRLGLPIPQTWEGQSMFSKPENEFTYHQMGDSYAVIHNRYDSLYKYTFNKETKKEQVYDLKKDLYEKNDIIKNIDTNYLFLLRSKKAIFHLDPD
jgi:lipoteichoic acid synthase